MNISIIKRSVLAIIILTFNTFFSTAQNQERVPSWTFFESIPATKSVLITGQNWSMKINDNYQVDFTATRSEYKNWTEGRYYLDAEHESSKSGRFEGKGVLLWDRGIKVKLNLKSSGSFSHIKKVYEREFVKTGERFIGNNAFTGRPMYEDEGYTENKHTHDVLENASGENTKDVEFCIDVNDSICRMPALNFGVHLSGDVNEYVSFSIPENTYKLMVEYKTAAEQSASTDQFGKWQWNKDRSKIFLESLGGGDNFVIWNRNDAVSWSLEMSDEIEGISESVTDAGDTLVVLNVSLDGSPERTLTFAKFNPSPEVKIIEEKRDTLVPVEIGDSTSFAREVVISSREEKVYNDEDKFYVENISDGMTLLNYAVYNRFLDVLDVRSESLLTEFKNYRILVVKYKIGEVESSAVFLLDGLESLMQYL